MNVITGPNLATLVLLSTFLFVLLIILLAKAPKVGAGVIFALLVVLPLAFLRGGISGGEVGLPIFTIWATFLFVLLVVLLAKQPKVGAALLAGLVFLGLFVLVLSHRRMANVAATVDAPWASVEVSSSPGYRMVPPVAEGQEIPQPLPPVVIPPEPAAASPIWSEGLEEEFEADVYPSKQAAAKALGLRIAAPIREIEGDPNTPLQVVFFQQYADRDLIEDVARSLGKKIPGLKYSIEADIRTNLRPGEVSVVLRPMLSVTSPSAGDSVKPWWIGAVLFREGRQESAGVQFIDKPWVEDFATFTSMRPEQHFIVTRSRGTCTSESEAHQQALDDARARLTEALGKRPDWERGGLPQPAITTTDVLQGGFVVDRFTQSFEGSASRLWRQALLLDVSGPKLTQLAAQKARELHSLRLSWARMGFSVIGVLVLIGVIYFFLNMATRGYYEWSLRIAGVVLAILAIISILMVVQ